MPGGLLLADVLNHLSTAKRSKNSKKGLRGAGAGRGPHGYGKRGYQGHRKKQTTRYHPYPGSSPGSSSCSPAADGDGPITEAERLTALVTKMRLTLGARGRLCFGDGEPLFCQALVLDPIGEVLRFETVDEDGSDDERDALPPPGLGRRSPAAIAPTR